MPGFRGWGEGLATRLLELPSVVADYTLGTVIVIVQLIKQGRSPAHVEARPRRLVAGSR